MIHLERDNARLETRIEIMEKMLTEMMGRRPAEQLTAGQGSSQPPPMLLHLLGVSGNGDSQLQAQQIETLHGVSLRRLSFFAIFERICNLHQL